MNRVTKGVALVGDFSNLSVRFTVGAEATNTIVVSLKVLDGNGQPTTVRKALNWYLSDHANGSSLAASAPSGTVAAGTNGLLIQTIAKKAGLVVCTPGGDMDVSIGEAGASTWYLVVVLPNGSLAISPAITFA